MNQEATPIFDALLKHRQQASISFHVPGHKNGTVFHPKGVEIFQPLLSIDATEITGLDDLHAPEGSILQAEELLADLYHAQSSFFLVNGSTAGNLAMILSACEDGRVVLVQRNCHKSIMNALKLANAQPVFLEPEYDKEWNLAGGVTFDVVRQALEMYPEARALVLTYPNYYGQTYDIEPLIAAAHERSIPVLVDEAHGPHFVLGDPFPPSALSLGADIVVQSAHKTLPAMTMGSYLHTNSKLIRIEKVKHYLQVFQSSSPSYPIMASLDLARCYLATYDPHDLNFLQKKIASFKVQLSGMPFIKVMADNKCHDPLKIVIRSTKGLSGFELQKRLEEAGIYSELADVHNILLVLPLLKKDQMTWLDEAASKVKAALEGVKGQRVTDNSTYEANNKVISPLMLTYKEMELLPSTPISLERAVGKVAAETIIPYPPGIPLLLEGEEISANRLTLIKSFLREGAHFQGGVDLAKGLVKVFRLPSTLRP